MVAYLIALRCFRVYRIRVSAWIKADLAAMISDKAPENVNKAMRVSGWVG